MYDITIFIGNHKNVSNGEIYGFLEFSELSDEFKNCAKGIKYSAYFVRGKLNPVYRKDDNLEKSRLLIIDGDSGVDGPLCDPETVHLKLKELGYNHFIYTTHSHSGEQNKYRVVVACEVYTRLELRRWNTELLKQLDCNIKYVKEMNAWTQPWFVPTRDDPSDGLFKYYNYTDGKDFSYEQDEQDESVDGRDDEQPDASVESLDEMYDNIRTGKEFHESTRTIIYQLAKDGVSRAHIRALIESLYNGSELSGSQRWQERFNDIERDINGAFDRIAEDLNSDFSVEDDDNILQIPDMPWPPGLLGDMCKSSYESMKIQHPELALMSSLGVLAAICGRKFNHIHGFCPKTHKPASPLGLNIYMTIVGSTGIGKSALEKFAKWIFHNVNEGKHSSFMGPASFTGPKALIDTLVLQRSIISVSTEAGIMLTTKSGDQSGLLGAKLNIYTQSDYNSYTDPAAFSSKDNSIPRLQSPSFTQLSESTPDVLYQVLKDTNALGNGLLPRQTLLVIPDYRPVKRNFYATFDLSYEVEQRLSELMVVASQVQSEEEPNPIFVTYKDDKMRIEAESIMHKYDMDRTVSTAEGIMATRMAPKVFKHASLITLMNNGLDKVENNILHIGWEEWEWAKELLYYEEKINSIFLDNMAGNDDIQLAIEVVITTLKKLLRGKHTSKKAQSKVGKAHRDFKCVGVNVIRDLLMKNPHIRQLNTGVGGHSIRTGLDKVLEYMEKMGKVKILKKSPITGRKAQIIKVLESINE